MTDKIKVATIRDLNKWGSLGLTEEEMNKTVKVTGKKVGEMKAADFIRIAIRFATE